MGCRCCRMIKSYIYDPSVAVDGRKSDSAGSSLYQPHHLSGDLLHGPPDPLGNGPHNNKQKQGFHNLGYSKSNDGTLKLEADNNHVNNRLHGGHGVGPERELARQGIAAPNGRLYIIQPETPGGPRWAPQQQDPRGPPSQVPVYPSMQDYSSAPSPYEHTDGRKGHYGDRRGHRPQTGNGWDSSIGDRCGTRSGSLSADEVDEGVGTCDTGDEGDSVRSLDDVHTSTTSVSSSDERGLPKTPDTGTMESGICVMKSEDEEPEEEEEEDEEREGKRRRGDDTESVTDSMVAEALAALEAATAGEEEDCECD